MRWEKKLTKWAVFIIKKFRKQKKQNSVSSFPTIFIQIHSPIIIIIIFFGMPEKMKIIVDFFTFSWSWLLLLGNYYLSHTETHTHTHLLHKHFIQSFNRKKREREIFFNKKTDTVIMVIISFVHHHLVFEFSHNCHLFESIIIILVIIYT